MIIAVDYDGTLMVNGKINRRLIGMLIARQRIGDKIILYSCRTGERLRAAVTECAKAGLHFNAINDNLPEITAKYGNSRKIYADLYIDDKAIKP